LTVSGHTTYLCPLTWPIIIFQLLFFHDVARHGRYVTDQSPPVRKCLTFLSGKDNNNYCNFGGSVQCSLFMYAKLRKRTVDRVDHVAWRYVRPPYNSITHSRRVPLTEDRKTRFVYRQPRSAGGTAEFDVSRRGPTDVGFPAPSLREKNITGNDPHCCSLVRYSCYC